MRLQSISPFCLASIVCLGLLGSATATGVQTEASGTALDIPLAEWINDGEQEDFDWDIDIDDPRLRMDQHFEIAVKARVEVGELGEAVEDHRLNLITVVTDRDGVWLGISEPEQETLPAQAHEDTGIELEMYVSLIPGRYVVWAILYDETTGQKNVSRERREVDDIGNDPIPEAYADFPVVRFARVEHTAGLTVRDYDTNLSIPVANRRPLDVELVTTISAPEQWPGGAAVTRHIENLFAGLRVLSQIDLASGSLSVTGLDLVRRRIALELSADRPVDWSSVLNTFDDVNRSAVSVEALLGREDNAAFLRDYVRTRLPGATGDRSESDDANEPLKVLIVVAGVMRFDDDADRDEIEFEGECDCRIYHIRFKQDRTDLFDQLDDLLESLDPPTFDVVSARDFRKVVGEIADDLALAER